MQEQIQPHSATALYTVRPSPSKGLGAFATAPIPSGSLILAEPPTIILMQEAHAIRDADIEATLPTLSEAQRTAFAALSAPPTQYQSELLRKFMGNSMSPAGLPGTTCLCLQIARFNHSCDPNAEMAWNPFTGSFNLYAIRAISADEEIVWNYIPGSNYMPRSYRRFLHFLNWRFVCTCAKCAGDGMSEPSRNREDAQRERMYSLRNALQGFELEALGRDEIRARGIDVEETWAPGELDAILDGLWQPPRPSSLPADLKDMDAKAQFGAWIQLADLMEDAGICGKELALARLNAVDVAIGQMEGGGREGEVNIGMVDQCVERAMRGIYASRPPGGPDVRAFEAMKERWVGLRGEMVRRLRLG